MFIHQPVGSQYCAGRRHCVLHFLFLRHSEPFRRHVFQPYSLRLLLRHFHLQPESAELISVSADVENVASVIIQQAQLQRDAVHRRQPHSGKRGHDQECRQIPVLCPKKICAQAERRQDEIHQDASEIIEDIGHPFLRQLRRGHQTLSACTGNRKPLKTDLAVLLDPHQASDTIRGKSIPAQQSAYEMTCLMDRSLQEKSEVNAKNKIQEPDEKCSALRIRASCPVCISCHQPAGRKSNQEDNDHADDPACLLLFVFSRLLLSFHHLLLSGCILQLLSIHHFYHQVLFFILSRSS